MSIYVVTQVTISDPQKYERYLEGFMEVLSDYDGEIVALDDTPRVIEGDWPLGRTIVGRFSDEAEFHRWYDSPEYQELVKIRHAASRANMVVVNEFAPPGP